MTSLTPVVRIAWDGSAFDDVTADVRNTPGISIQRGKDSARPRSPAMVAACDIVLGNQNHRYSSQNAGSDIYPYVLPDRPISVGQQSGVDQSYEAAITYNADATYYNGVGSIGLFTGYTDEPNELATIEGERRAQIRSLGKMAALRGTLVSSALYSSIRTDQSIGHVLDSAGWPADDRVISTGDTTLDWWWVTREDAWNALMDLLETEGAGASLYEDGQGRIHFENRNYRAITSRSTTSQATFSAAAGHALGFESYQYAQQGRDIYNAIEMEVWTRASVSGEIVWTNGSEMVLAANETRHIYATINNPASSITAPTVTTDYVVTAGSLVSFTATLDWAEEIHIIVVAGGSGATVTGPGSTGAPQIRGTWAPQTSRSTVRTTVTPSPYFSDRMRTLDLIQAGARNEVSQATAQALVNAAADFYGTGRPDVVFTFANRDAARVTQMTTREVSDRITVNAGANEFQGDVWIDQINHEITEGGRVARCTIVGGKISGTGGSYVENPATWDAGAWDEGLWAN